MAASTRRSKTDGEFLAWLAEAAPGYRAESAYTNNKAKVTIRHLACGHAWEARPDMLARGRRCPRCFGTGQGTSETFQADLDRKFGPGAYAVVGEYVRNSEAVVVRHLACGKIWLVRPRDALAKGRTNGCFHCFGTPMKTDQEFRNRVVELCGAEYEPLEAYSGLGRKLKMLHRACGQFWEVRPGNFTRPYGDRCPRCNLAQRESRGVRLIRQILIEKGLEFEEEKRFHDCVSARNRVMPFDFYVESLGLAIEYDGPQHTYAMSNRGGSKKFRYTLENDRSKDEYCRSKGIRLVRVSYFREASLRFELERAIENARTGS